MAAALATAEDKIANMGMETLSTQEKSGLIAAVESLRQTIYAFFDQVAQES